MPHVDIFNVITLCSTFEPSIVSERLTISSDYWLKLFFSGLMR